MYTFDVVHHDYLWLTIYDSHWLFQIVCRGRERVGGYGCYDVVVKPGGMTWREAGDSCTDMGKALLAIESSKENDAINNYLQQNEGK